MNKCLVLFVEGDTEVEFYKRIISDARNRMPNRRLNINIEIRNIEGVGGFKNIALRKFIKDIKRKYGIDYEYTIVLCRDSDVFELAQKPPVNWNEVETAFFDNGASKVIHIEAIHTIEDWFLYDFEGILSFLRLPKSTKMPKGNGYERLKTLFRKADKMYYKGMKSNGMVERLDIKKIVHNIHDQIGSLYNALMS